MTIFLGVWIWNDFIDPLIILGPSRGTTVTTGIYRSIGQYQADFGSVFALMVLATLPVLIFYPGVAAALRQGPHQRGRQGLRPGGRAPHVRAPALRSFDQSADAWRCEIAGLSSDRDEDWYPGADTERWARNVDQTVPSAARMYDYFLGGSHNFEADRRAADKVIEAMPDAPLIARVNRSFLERAVRFLLAQGIRQFLDIGSGVPTVGNVHEIAQSLDPEAAVVYVDLDPVAVTHARQLLHDNERATAIVADLRRPAELAALLRHPHRRAVLDLDRPVGLLLVSMLHFVPGDEAYDGVAALADLVAPGSYLVISHPIAEAIEEQTAHDVGAVYQTTTTPGGLRSRAEVERFFAGFELVPPGLTWAPHWHPDGGRADDRELSGVGAGRLGMVAGVGRKPG